MELLDLLARLGEGLLARRPLLDRRLLDTNGGSRLRQLPPYARLQVQKRVELRIREERAQEHLQMRAPDPVHAAVPLHEPHRVPRQIVVHHVAALLEVHPLGEDVGAQEEIEAILGVRRERSRRDRREAVQRLLPGDPAAHLRAAHGSDAAAVRGEAWIALDRLE